MIDRSGLRLIYAEITMITVLFLINFILNSDHLVFLIILSLFSLLFTLLFFRDPPRDIGEGIVSPADGRVDFVGERRIEIFMSPFDCHVNRAPVSGVVEKVVYKKGSFIPAYRRNDFSERNEIFIRNEKGLFRVIQIAGFFARRINCYVKEGDFVEKGQKIGIIKFGSRVVLEIPDGYAFVVKEGEKIKAGRTIAVEA
ncbi:phosphatidylserine decarboxylase precursor-related protein [Archaeoglobus sulfaticallidus PM70-1]|uniref:Phosphatidylserine decarboxylase-related protein n=1 Tax=Archaeoglobus sulfaticallidus PM70-1 TaxID=387631 RepID=N0BIG3_9EURY|nr:phosphatidylserine decarboxylase precursor-related protein [Archaeoglobus sulfaticallidus PM70-1]